jgi:four helix bundle protein
MGPVEEETDESVYWMELLAERGIASIEKLQPLMAEGSEIVAMTVASIKTAKRSKK